MRMLSCSLLLMNSRRNLNLRTNGKRNWNWYDKLLWPQTLPNLKSLCVLRAIVQIHITRPLRTKLYAIHHTMVNSVRVSFQEAQKCKAEMFVLENELRSLRLELAEKEQLKVQVIGQESFCFHYKIFQCSLMNSLLDKFWGMGRMEKKWKTKLWNYIDDQTGSFWQFSHSCLFGFLGLCVVLQLQ